MLEPYLQMLLYSLPFVVGPLERGIIPNSTRVENDGTAGSIILTIRTWEDSRNLSVKQYENRELTSAFAATLDENDLVLSDTHLWDVSDSEAYTRIYTYSNGKLIRWTGKRDTAFCFYRGGLLDSVFQTGESFTLGGEIHPVTHKFEYYPDQSLKTTMTVTRSDGNSGPSYDTANWGFRYYLPDSIVVQGFYQSKTYYLRNEMPIKMIFKDWSGIAVQKKTTTWSYQQEAPVRKVHGEAVRIPNTPFFRDVLRRTVDGKWVRIHSRGRRNRLFEVN